MPASASAGRVQMGLVLSGSKGFWQKNRRPGYSALRRHAGEQPDRRPALAASDFSSHPARTRTRDGALEHAELAPGSDDATKKLDAKGRPIDFKELLRIQRHYQRPQVRARIEGAGLIWRAAASCRSRRSPDTIDGKKVPRSGSLPRRTALFSHSRGLWTNRTSVRKAMQPADIFALSNLRAERRGRPRPCESKGGDPDDDRRGSLL